MKNIKKILVSVLALVVLTTMLSASAFASIGKAIYIDGKSSMYVGKTQTLSFYVGGTKVSNKTWKSSNTSVATVSTKGKVTAKKAGKTTISAKAGNGKATFTITVKKKPALGTTSIVSITNVPVQSGGPCGHKVVWKKASYATGYKIYRKRTDYDGAKYVLIGTVSGGSTLEYTYQADEGGYYNYKVRPVRNDYLGTYSAYKSCVCVPTIELTRVQSAYGEGGMHIEWRAQSAYGKHHIDGFKIYKKIGENGTYEYLDTIDKTEREYYDKDTIPGTRYYYYVIGYIGNTLGSPTASVLNHLDKWSDIAEEFPTE